MRIDKAKVKEIIEEEIAAVVVEALGPGPGRGRPGDPTLNDWFKAHPGAPGVGRTGSVAPWGLGLPIAALGWLQRRSKAKKAAAMRDKIYGREPQVPATTTPARRNLVATSGAQEPPPGAAAAAKAAHQQKTLPTVATSWDPAKKKRWAAVMGEGTKSIDLIKKLVEQELREIDGGIMDPNMVPFVPHREPAADPPKESEEEDTEVDRLYRIAVKARLATEALVEALDDPIYDQAYDNAFKATMALRDSLNSLIDQGAKPLDSEQLVAPPEADQPRQDAPGYAIPFAGITYSGDNV